jgi:hypothetical protein
MAPSLTRGRVCNMQRNDASSISSYIATDGLSASSSSCLTWSSQCRAPSPISPMNRVMQSKVKVTLVQGEISNSTIGRAAWEACSATWNLGANSAFALGPRKTTENLDRVGRSQDLTDANWLLASSPALNPRALTLVPKLCCCGVRGVHYIYNVEADPTEIVVCVLTFHSNGRLPNITHVGGSHIFLRALHNKRLG